ADHHVGPQRDLRRRVGDVLGVAQLHRLHDLVVERVRPRARRGRLRQHAVAHGRQARGARHGYRCLRRRCRCRCRCRGSGLRRAFARRFATGLLVLPAEPESHRDLLIASRGGGRRQAATPGAGSSRLPLGHFSPIAMISATALEMTALEIWFSACWLCTAFCSARLVEWLDTWYSDAMACAGASATTLTLVCVTASVI